MQVCKPDTTGTHRAKKRGNKYYIFGEVVEKKILINVAFSTGDFFITQKGAKRLCGLAM